MKFLPTFTLLITLLSTSFTTIAHGPHGADDKFRQLDEILPTPNEKRLASGIPGPEYWQQKVDYVMDIHLDDEQQKITGSELITYHNNSPHTLKYLWVQLDQNRFKSHSDNHLAKPAPDFEKFYYDQLQEIVVNRNYAGGFNITAVKDGQGQALKYTINKTMMRVELEPALESGKQFTFSIDWWYNIINAVDQSTRGGYEYFEKDENYIYEMSRFYPRLAAYMDHTGWQNKQFLGRGEFTLEMGDFVVNLTVPEDHVVASTGTLQNPDEVLTETQKERLQEARTAEKPVFIVTPREAKRNQSSKSTGEKTWTFKAENVRDFAFASSRKYIWDAQGYAQGDDVIMAMSFYPNEAEPLWSQYSTAAVIHTMKVYSRYSFDYPYPVSISVNGPIGGMEYPMITFNKPRPEEDGTYYATSKEGPWEHTKYGLISVIIHEVGHNYFPMIVNSDERQWTWMDEGLNTYLQFLAEQEWSEDYPSRRGEPQNIVEYMISDKPKVPIMTNSESLLQFGNNAYGKPATALNILRETVMGRELFDYAFRNFSEQWKFKHPTPSDFFRAMEDASAVDLDWFWNGWFYTIDHVDIAINKVHLYRLDSRNPAIENEVLRKKDEEKPVTISQQRNKDLLRLVDQNPELKDFYDTYDKFAVLPEQQETYEQLLEGLDDKEKALLNFKENFYVIEFENVGGLVMPLILQVVYEDGSEELVRMPAEIWRSNPHKIKKMIVTPKTIKSLELDPYLETADTDLSNNNWPAKPVEKTFQLYKDEHKPSAMKQAKEQ